MLRLSSRIFTWSTAPTNHSIWRANPQPGGKLPSHDVLLWDVFLWYCPGYFSAFEYYFPFIKHVFYLASSWTNPGQIAPSRYSPVFPTRQNLQTFSVSDVSDSDIWNIGQMVVYSIGPPRQVPRLTSEVRRGTNAPKRWGWNCSGLCRLQMLADGRVWYIFGILPV